MSVHDVGLFSDQGATTLLLGRFDSLGPEHLLRVMIRDLFPGKIALVSSFGADAAVLLHMVAQIDTSVPVIFVDTEKLFPETLAYRDALAAKLGLTDVRSTLPDQAQVAAQDTEDFLWNSDPDACCDIRKVQPLARAMEGFDAWITGRKRHQSEARAELPLFEAEGERMKINPLAGWSAGDVLGYIRRHELPSHPLVSKGYPSIGCVPCTSRVAPGEDPRAGRWRGRGKTECGMHLGILNAGSGI